MASRFGRPATPTCWATTAAGDALVRERLIAHHVESLVGLGWAWRGDCLSPYAESADYADSEYLTSIHTRSLSLEMVNFPTGKTHET